MTRSCDPVQDIARSGRHAPVSKTVMQMRLDRRAHTGGQHMKSSRREHVVLMYASYGSRKLVANGPSLVGTHVLICIRLKRDERL